MVLSQKCSMVYFRRLQRRVHLFAHWGVPPQDHLTTECCLNRYIILYLKITEQLI